MPLMEHQREGVEFLIQRRAGLLAFEQGLGKTLVAIESFRATRAIGAARRLLVICPNSLKRNWVAEITKFAPELEVAIAEGPPRSRRSVLATSRAAVLILSYETARSEVAAILAFLKKQPVALVLDESHATKNRDSLTSIAARHFAPHAAFRWLLSGTPVTNSPGDLHTQIDIIAPGERPIGSYDSFMALAETQLGLERIRAKAAPFILRRTKEQCLDLPEKLFVDMQIELPEWQRKLYDDMRSAMVCEIQGMTGEEYRAFASTALARLTRLAQIASNPALLFSELTDTPGKVAELDHVLAEILAEPGRKVIIWSNFVDTIEMLVARYSQFGSGALYGGTPTERRQEIAARFQTDPALRVLVGNPAAAGTGFTLTAATYTIYETLSWRYDFYAQSQDRNHRIGQSMPVTYMRMIAVDTIEEAIVQALERKSSMARDLLGDESAQARVSELTSEQMCQLLLTNRLPSTE